MLDLAPRQLATLLVRALGDVPGHEFHGNQWTHGAGGNEWRKIDRHEGQVLNNVAMHTVHDPDFSQSVNPAIQEPDLIIPKGKHVSAGVVMTEPDGRVWVVEPHNRYGGYRNTFPKGTVDEGESLQETAAREVWEETGLVTKITGHLVDVERSTSVARFYTGVRVGGAPWAAGKETHAVKLMPIHGKGAENNLKNVFGRETSDRKVLDALRSHLKQKTLSVRILGDVPGHEFHGNQWTDGKSATGTFEKGRFTPDLVPYAHHKVGSIDIDRELSYGGMHTRMDRLNDVPGIEVISTDAGHPELAGGKISTIGGTDKPGFNFRVKSEDDARRLGRALRTDDTRTEVHNALLGWTVNVDSKISNTGRNQTELRDWWDRTLDRLEKAQDPKALGDLPGHEFHGNQYTGSWPEGLKNISGAKGSNPGGLYVDKHGQKWYVKRYNNPQQAQTEHIANAVYRAVGVEAPHSVLGEGGDYASKVIAGEGTLAKVGLNKDRANKILDGFAADVFLDNWDAVGTGHDNILISGDRAIRIDQGGTLTFRAQGAPKPEAGLEKIGEWESLVNQNHYYNAIFKAAGVKNGDALGERAAKQIDKIVAARPAKGWKELIDKVAPKADVSFRAKAARMLEARQKLLEQKRDQLRGVKALGDVEGHPFHGNQWTSGISPENAKLYSGHHIDARKIAAVTGQIIRGEKLDPVAFGATDQHVDAARELVTSVRNAQEHSKPLYRGIGSEDPIPALENLKVGDKITFDRTTSFSSSREYASYYSERHSGGGIGHNYELRTEGPIKSVPTDKMTGLDHQEHITHGRFEVVGIDEPKTGVLVKVPKSVTGGNREFYVTHGRSIRLRQVGVL